MFIEIKYIRATDKISFNGIQNHIKLVSKNGGFKIVSIEVKNGGFKIVDDEDISNYVKCKFVLNGDIQTEDLDRSNLISIPDEVDPIKRERKVDFEVEQSAKSSVVGNKEEHDKFNYIMDAVIEGAKLHGMFKALKTSEELVDNTLMNLCFEVDYSEYNELYHSIELLRGSAPKINDNKFKICYADYKNALNVINNAVPLQLGTNPTEVMLNKGSIPKYKFPDGKCRSLADDNFLSDAIKTSDTMDVSDLKNKSSFNIPTWKILFLSVMMGALNYIANIIHNVPVVGCKIAKIFYRQANRINEVIKGYTTIDLGIGSVDLGLSKNDADVSCDNSDDGNIDDYLSDEFNDISDALGNVDLSNSGSCLAASQRIMDVYKNKVTEYKPEKLAGLLFKAKVKGMRHALAAAVVKDLDKYIPGVASVLMNDVTEDKAVGFYWKPVIDKIISDAEAIK